MDYEPLPHADPYLFVLAALGGVLCTVAGVAGANHGLWCVQGGAQ